MSEIVTIQNGESGIRLIARPISRIDGSLVDVTDATSAEIRLKDPDNVVSIFGATLELVNTELVATYQTQSGDTIVDGQWNILGLFNFPAGPLKTKPAKFFVETSF